MKLLFPQQLSARRSRRFFFGSVAGLLASCIQSPPRDFSDFDQPIFGSQGETRFAMSTSNGVLRIRDVAAVAKVLRRYKTLEKAEKSLIKVAVERHLDALVSLEVKRIAPNYSTERHRIDSLPDRQAARQESARLDAQILREAAIRVADRLSRLVAIPVKAAGNRSVVAFAKVAEGQVEVADATYEVDTPPGMVGEGTKIPLPSGADAQGVASLRARPSVMASVIAGNPVLLK